MMTANARYEGYDEGFADGEASCMQDAEDARAERDDALDALRAAQVRMNALEAIARQVVTHFGDLASTMRKLTDLRPREVDELKRVTRDAPILVVDDRRRYHDRRR